MGNQYFYITEANYPEIHKELNIKKTENYVSIQIMALKVFDYPIGAARWRSG